MGIPDFCPARLNGLISFPVILFCQKLAPPSELKNHLILKLNYLGTNFVCLLSEWDALLSTVHCGFIKLRVSQTLNS